MKKISLTSLIFVLLTCFSISAQTPIPCDGDVSGNISVLGEVDLYTFSGQTGDRIIIRMKGDAFSLDAKIELLNPAGMVVASNASTSAGLARIGTPNFQLTSTGTYTIRASDNGNNETEAYGLSLQILQSSCATPIGCSDDLNGNISRSAEMDAYYFEGQAGERIITRMKGDAFSLDANLELYFLPTGAQVAEDANTASGLARIGNPTAALPGTGTYLLLAMDNGGDDDEAYGLSLQFLKPACATPIGCADDIGGSISKSAEMDAYYFEGQAGERIIARMKGDAYSLDANLELYFLPTGAQVAEDANTASGLARIGDPTAALPGTGTYLLLAMDNGGDDDEAYGLSLQFLKPACATPIGCSDDIGGSISKSAEMDAYYFEGQIGERVIARMKGDAYSLDADLELYFLPTGAQVAEGANTASGLARIGDPTAVLPGSGTYLLLAMDNGGDDEEAYGLSLQFLKPACATPIGCSDDIGGSISKSAEMDAYYFEGQIGERIIARMKGDAYSLDADLELYFLPTGAQVAENANTASGLAKIGDPTAALPGSGTYLLLAMDNGGDDEEAYGLSLQVLKPACATSIGCSDDMGGSIAKSAEMDAWHLPAQPGNRLILQIATVDFSLDMRLEVYDTSGHLLRTLNVNGNSLARDTITLPTPIFLLAMDDDGNDLGNYIISLQLLRTSCVQWLGCGGDVSANISKVAQMEGYAFQADSAKLIRIRASETASSFAPEISVYRKGHMTYERIFSASVFLDTVFPAPATDTFFLVYRDKLGHGLGAYGLSVQILDVDCAAPFACNADTAASLAFQAEMDAYRFSGIAGQRVLLRAYAPSFIGRMEIYNANGLLLSAFETLNNLIEQSWPLPSSGDYLVLFFAKSGTATGVYGFSAQLLDLACVDANLSDCHHAFTTSLDNTAQMRAYQVSIPSNQRVVLRGVAVQPGLDLHFDLYNLATGQSISADENANGAVRLDHYNNTPNTQTLVLVVTDKGGDETGGYHLSLQRIGQGVACGIALDCATNTASASISLPGDLQTFTFHGDVGDRGILRATDENNGIVLRAELYDPNGLRIGTPVYYVGGSVRFNYGLLMVAGDYTLLTMDTSGLNIGNVAVAFEDLRDMTCGTPIIYNTNLLPNFTNYVEMSHFVLDAAAGDIIIAQAKGVSASFDTEIEVYNEQGILVKSAFVANGMARVDTLPLAAGKYKIMVLENEGDELGAYGLSLQKVNPGFNAPLMPIVGFLTDMLDQPAASHVYVFSGNAGDVVCFEMNEITSVISPRFELYDPAGIKVQTVTNTTSAKVINYHLLATGTYTALAMDDNGMDIGSYQIGNFKLIAPPTAAFEVMGGVGCQPLTVHFVNASSASPTTFMWSFPGGSPMTSTLENPVVTYQNPGTYAVSLTVSNLAGSDSEIQTNVVIVNPLPISNFTFIVNGFTVTFTNISTNANSNIWDFGDGSTSTAPNPVHTYSDDGIYTVTLTTGNTCGPDVFAQPVSVNTPPIANFSANPPIGCAPLTVQFNNASSGNATSFQWSFPGGSPMSSTLTNPSVVYNTPGTYSATLTAFNAAGSSTEVKTSYIVVNTTPASNFTFMVNGTTVTFTNLTLNASGYLWTFGDGSTSTLANPTHTYASCGIYNVTLAATNDCGTSAISFSVTIVMPPTAIFNANTTSGCPGLTVSFSDQSGCGPTAWLWSFLGGTPGSSTDSNPVVTYQTAGNYPVMLTVINTAGSNTVSFNDYITVENPPIAEFTFVKDQGTLTFVNTSQYGNTYFWDFGDGDTSTQQNPVHVYTTSGTYTVTLTATNACGTNVFTKQILVMVVSTNELGWVEVFRLSPNPSSGLVQIQTFSSNKFQMVLFDTNGNQIRDFEMETLDYLLDMTDLPIGFYVLRISDGERVGTLRLAVVR